MQQSSKSNVQQDLQRKVEEFLAAGGKVQGVASGETGEEPERWNWNTSHYRTKKKARHP